MSSEEKIEPSSRLEWLRKKIHFGTEIFFRTLFFWETDEKKLGQMVRLFHHSVVYLTLFAYITLHTFVHSYFLFLLFYGWIALVWLQHLLTGGCIVSKIEQKLLGDSTCFVGPIMEAANIPVTPESTIGFTVLGSTFFMFVLTFELLLRTILNVKEWIPSMTSLIFSPFSYLFGRAIQSGG